MQVQPSRWGSIRGRIYLCITFVISDSLPLVPAPGASTRSTPTSCLKRCRLGVRRHRVLYLDTRQGPGCRPPEIGTEWPGARIVDYVSNGTRRIARLVCRSSFPQVRDHVYQLNKPSESSPSRIRAAGIVVSVCCPCRISGHSGCQMWSGAALQQTSRHRMHWKYMYEVSPCRLASAEPRSPAIASRCLLLPGTTGSWRRRSCAAWCSRPCRRGVIAPRAVVGIRVFAAVVATQGDFCQAEVSLQKGWSGRCHAFALSLAVAAELRRWVDHS